MAPAQALADVDEGRKPEILIKSEAEAVSREKMMISDAAGLMCENNCEDSRFYAESSCDLRKVDDIMDQEIDIPDCNDDVAMEKVEVEESDATEYSSSFGDTGSDNESKLNQSDVEVDSGFSLMNDNPDVFNRFNRVFKKKKKTAHWRNFISPLMWRCQWLELRIKELQYQALKYNIELGAYKHGRELVSKLVELDGSVSRLVPLTGRSPTKNVMKRGKRKRNEDIADIPSFMSNHHIFSYYENKRTETDGLSVDDDCGDQDENVRGIEDNEWLLGIKGHDSSLEQILLKIEAVQSRVLKLKTHLSKVMCRNDMEISSSPGNLFPSGLPPSYPQSHIGSPENNGDGLPVGAVGTPPLLVTEYEMEDMVMPESAVSSYGDAADVDIIERTMGLLSSADGLLDQYQIRDLCKDSADDVLIDNQAAEGEFQNFEKVSYPSERPQELVKEEAESPSEEESIAPQVSTPEPGPEIENVDMSQQTVLKPCYSGKRRGRKPKRKRRGGSVAALNNLRSEMLQKRRILGGKS